MRGEISKRERVLNIWAVILIVWSIYRSQVHAPEWFDEFIAKPGVFVVPVLWYIRYKEKKDFFLETYLRSKHVLSDILFGLAAGALFFLSAFSANFIRTGKFVIPSNMTISSLLFFIILAFATAFSEEILSRGFVLKRLYEESKNAMSSSFFASILYFFLHVPILFTTVRMSGSSLLLFMATDIILSLINSFIFLQRKSLVLPIFIHALYNITVLFFV
ncbi:hypothetical protein COT62_01130 [Candidatus Roizmanbacteria bacterium CG09_land_8_20_14_0_10_41_9]|uniref:CAAX prenyl protease 2/Lysostaphin resistance protein A-like domain-containing protein n=1 Tax=Candidatus Roizmanbacteria bacterium CG09_land_8_20_14_0_10_41_9 TaxID=1974850 RepID=A0A2H0WTD3_9BACT|nr:MAG: hypothetical protein COT62_01130 [Candidatus Roizmanbacteria bacterium CG09_land_8_20_14_0_10_41_9]